MAWENDAALNIRLPAAQKAAIVAKAKERGLSIGELVREKLGVPRLQREDSGTWNGSPVVTTGSDGAEWERLSHATL